MLTKNREKPQNGSLSIRMVPAGGRYSSPKRRERRRRRRRRSPVPFDDSESLIGANVSQELFVLTDRDRKISGNVLWSRGIRRANRNGRKQYRKWLFLRGGADGPPACPTLRGCSSRLPRSCSAGCVAACRATGARRGWTNGRTDERMDGCACGLDWLEVVDRDRSN
ncbi:hypothetical protein GWI33_001973 [Rhynchophorus ferrugineus]|uniref:Uncharacterized protein n=1 Tax=Rhynchophorus ferrugineus TaxID=354439 RepID=A0A834IYX0_RHYFE|nr:hypothetical protein GWI33_001973 [Rhynchophorus ferrugineus]